MLKIFENKISIMHNSPVALQENCPQVHRRAMDVRVLLVLPKTASSTSSGRGYSSPKVSNSY